MLHPPQDPPGCTWRLAQGAHSTAAAGSLALLLHVQIINTKYLIKYLNNDAS
jgi:hypothetical protein